MTYNPLFLLPPELAHKTALTCLKTGLVPPVKIKDRHKVSLLGKTWRNPVGAAAGMDKDGEALTGWKSLGFGFIEAGTVVPVPRKGNPKPRVWRFTKQNSLVNWLGFPSRGPQTLEHNIRHFRKKNPKTDFRIGISIASVEGNAEDFSALARRFGSLADYMTLNISCPNTGKEQAALDAMSAQIKAVSQAAPDCPLLVKLGPTHEESVLQTFVSGGLDAGASGFVATNTVPPEKKHLLENRDFDWPRHEGREVGGYSGPQLLDISTWMIRRIRQIAGPDIPLIGVGGIQCGTDARRMLDSGADAVQLYTGLIYSGPGIVSEILDAL